MAGSVSKRPDGRYRARYRDDARKEHAKHFDTKRDAQRWLDNVTASKVTGQYVDPTNAKMKFRVYAEQWRSGKRPPGPDDGAGCCGGADGRHICRPCSGTARSGRSGRTESPERGLPKCRTIEARGTVRRRPSGGDCRGSWLNAIREV
jgi:hypothetical protein